MQTNHLIATDTDPNDHFLEYYFPGSGFDEMCVRLNEPRQSWKPLINALNHLGDIELQQRCQEARRLLRDNGVTINTYGDSQGLNRPWQLDLIPLLMNNEEWTVIEQGLIQRAELLRLILADLYGARELFQKNLLPPELIYSHPGFLRRCDGIAMPADKYQLPLYAADLARTTEGQMCVVGDRTQTPTGAGYALENRIVLSRVLPNWFRDLQVRRLARFFHTMRNTLMNMVWRKSDDIRIVVLTTGPDDNTYFEHAFLATYLGYTLVQGADLTVREGRVWLKTLDGLQPVDMILRYIDDHLCDPLELHQDSYFGVAGLLQAVRMKKVVIANPLGTGILENPALMAFLPALARYFLGEDLKLPSAMTWWCGLKKERDYVLANLHHLIIKKTTHQHDTYSIRGELLGESERKALHEQILAQPYLFIGQEEIPRSTIPVFTNGSLEPRQMVVRSFLVATDEDYRVMPGGLTRVAFSPYTPIIAAQSDGVNKDTWILADQPEKPISLLPPSGQISALVNGQAEMPSRVAENLFWLGRYAERAESILRLLRTVLQRILEPMDLADASTQTCLHNLLRAVTHLTKTYPGFVGEGAEERLMVPATELLSILLDKSRAGSLSSTLKALLYAANAVRDRTSSDIKRVFSSLEEGLQALYAQREISLQPKHSKTDEEMLKTAFEKLNHLLIHFAALTGLAMESMTHGQGWRFLVIGRHLERAQQMIPLLRTMLARKSSNESMLLEHLLIICDSLMTYRSRYRTVVQIQPILDLLLLDESNPRSLGYQFEQLQSHVQQLPRCDRLFAHKTSEQRLALEGLTRLRLANMEELIQVDETNHFRTNLDQLLVRLNHLLPNLSDAITHSYFSHIEPPKPLVRFTGGNGL